LEDV
jgi:hypothetical protein